MKLTELQKIVRQLFFVQNKKQKKKSIILLIIIFIGAFWEMLGVTAIIPFMSAIMSPEVLTNNAYVAKMIAICKIEDTNQLIIIIGVLLIGVYLLKNLYLLIEAYIKAKFQCQFQKELSVYMLASYEKRPYTFFVNASSGDIFRGITNDIAGVYTIQDNLFKMLAEFATILFIAVAIFFIDYVMAISVLMFAGISLLLITLLFSKKMKTLGVIQRDMMSEKYKDASQAVYGIKDIKVMKREKNFVKHYDDTIGKQMAADTSYYFAGSCPERLIEAVCICGIIGMILVKILRGIDIASFVPSLAAMAVAAFRILPSFSRLSGYINGIIYFRPTLDATYENVIEAHHYEKIEEEDAIRLAAVNQERKLTFDQGITVDHISWCYPEREENVLEDMSLFINKGEAIGLIGASGAGKSTFGDILLGLYRPQQGKILADDWDIYEYPEQWSHFIGYVPQAVFLLDDTIRNNVIFQIDVNEIQEERVWQALEEAQLADFVRALPEQLDTIVGDRGVKFSGGQRQRIAIARALYYNPQILILDEATSALDNETEIAVMQAIEKLQHEKTMIIIAHRLSTIEQCDKIYQIENGKAVEKKKEELFGNAD